MLAGLGISLGSARVGLIGAGNIGLHIYDRLRDQDTEVAVVELADTTRRRLKEEGVRTWRPEDKLEFLKNPMHAVVVNASGGTLDRATIDAIVKNGSIKVVCGCENLVMPDPSGVEMLREHGILFAPTEFCGMMGYLTAVEEYLSYLNQREFAIDVMFDAAPKLEEAGQRAAKYAVRSGHSVSFAAAVEQVYS